MDEAVVLFLQQLFDIAPIIAVLSLALFFVWRRLNVITDRYTEALEEETGWLRERFLVGGAGLTNEVRPLSGKSASEDILDDPAAEGDPVLSQDFRRWAENELMAD